MGNTLPNSFRPKRNSTSHLQKDKDVNAYQTLDNCDLIGCGIFNQAERFWKRKVGGFSQPVQKQLNAYILGIFCEVSPAVADVLGENCELWLETIDCCAHISTILETIKICGVNIDRLMNDCYFQQLAKQCDTLSINGQTIIDVWLKIETIFETIFGKDFNIATQWCIHVLLLFVASAVDRYLAELSTAPQTNDTPTMCASAKGGDDTPTLSQPQLTLSLYSSVSKTEDLFETVLNRSWNTSAEKCLTNPFGVMYLCKFIEGLSCLHPEVVWYWKDISKYRNMSSRNCECEKMALEIFGNYFTVNGVYSLSKCAVIDKNTETMAQQLCSDGEYRIAFDVVYRKVMRWCDKTVIPKFNKTLTRHLKQ